MTPDDLAAALADAEVAKKYSGFDAVFWTAATTNVRALLLRLAGHVEAMAAEVGRLREATQRTPLSRSKEELRAYLAANGPSTRKQILADTHILPGSLSALLGEPEFERAEYGVWRLRAAADALGREGE